MKYPQKFRNLIRENAENLRKKFYLGEYDMTIEYMEEDYDDASADIEIDSVYLTLKLRIYPAFYKDYQEDNYWIKRYLIHEFSHALLEPIEKQVKDLQNGLLITNNERVETLERQTQRITNIICDLLLLRTK